MPKKKTDDKLTTDDKLDIIVEFLRRMDKRDRLRIWGGFFRGLLGLIPLAVMLFSVWYVYEHGDELLQKITQQAAKEAAAMTSDSAQDILKQFEVIFPGGTQ
jgi:cadmium resistance protein CadD (predicted permease)